jgi:hypothetical protein
MALHRVFRSGCRIAALCLLSLAFSATAAEELSEAQRKERCDNNFARLNELDAQLAGLKLPLAETEWRKAQDDLNVVRIAVEGGQIAFTTEIKALFTGYSAKYGYGWASCLASDMVACGEGLKLHIAKLLDASHEMKQQILKVQEQIKFHETNVVALNCRGDGNAMFTVAGTWNTNWGTMELQGDTSVAGKYAYQEGRVEGILTGRVCGGYWAQARSGKECKESELGSKYWGRFTMTFAANGKSFGGSWGYCNGPLSEGSWAGTR